MEMFVIKGSTLQLKRKSLYKGQSNEMLLPFQAALHQSINVKVWGL